ncbi:MAG TPA: tol-pal system protein YbgF [Mariprofundaceae bacterium]|nr:tol-pal system protein YbgF [Mariprofundaceae bacterium]
MKRPSVYPVAALFVLLVFSGCVPKGGASWQADKEIVLQSIQKTQAANASMQDKIATMEARVIELEKSLKQQEADNKALMASMIAVRKAMPRKIVSSKVSTKDQKLARKLEKIESSIRSATTKGADMIQPSDKSIEKNSYTAAYLALKSGRYEESSIAFKMLLQRHPQGEYADQAWFWLGESYFAQRKYSGAIDAFNEVANNYPESAKHPAALLKLASAYQESRRRGDAKAALQRLIRQHPESNAAEQARSELMKMDKEQKK